MRIYPVSNNQVNSHHGLYRACSHRIVAAAQHRCHIDHEEMQVIYRENRLLGIRNTPLLIGDSLAYHGRNKRVILSLMHRIPTLHS